MPHKDYKACGIFMLFPVAMNSQVHCLHCLLLNHHHHHHCHFSHHGASKQGVISCIYLKMQYYCTLSEDRRLFPYSCGFYMNKTYSCLQIGSDISARFTPPQAISLNQLAYVSEGLLQQDVYCLMPLSNANNHRTFLACSDSVCVGEREREREIGWMDEKQNKLVLAHNS